MEKDSKYWEELERRYFDGETTEAEEAELERRMASLSRAGKENSTTAAMAYVAVGRKLSRDAMRRRRGTWSALAAAASVALVISIGATFLARGGGMTGCVVVDGQRVAEIDGAIDAMRDDLALLTEACPQVDDELTLFLESDSMDE